MTEFITSHLKLIIIITVVLLVLGFLPEVTELPFGMDNVFTTFVGMMQMLLETIDFLRVPWYLFLAYMTIEAGFFLWKWINYFINLYK